MSHPTRTSARHHHLLRTGAVGALVLLSACSYVKRDDLAGQLNEVRQEMRGEMAAGDEALGQRIDGLDARVATVEERIASLEMDLGALEDQFNVTVERLETAIRFNTPVYFDFDAAEIRPQDEALLQRFAQVVMEYYPATLITVEGFTDPAGEAAYNRMLGQRRADAVKAYLVEQGLAVEHVKAVSYGEQTERLVNPADTGPGDSGWQNRRVVLVIDHGDASPNRGLITDDSGR